jgi:hypothetical protein
MNVFVIRMNWLSLNRSFKAKQIRILRNFILIFCLSPFFGSYAQESCELSGEVEFPFFTYYSVYGLQDTLARQGIAIYESNYKKAKSKNKLNKDLQLFALVKKNGLLFNPYVIVIDNKGKELVIYMDSATYQKTGLWNYTDHDLIANQHYLWFEATGIWLGENAYLLTEYNQIILMEDKSRSQRFSKLGKDVYQK